MSKLMWAVKGMLFAAVLALGLGAVTPGADGARSEPQAKKNNGGKKKLIRLPKHDAKKNNGGKKKLA